ncbi:transketolase family protein [Deinococcus gobiensis]|uniref:Transketolase central region n=1 Tax=Deinococcus gobiensis (strain DSM 21396 / JCM 16679 / CGMCC 1.7299 / I-0) TaxID=745776 RepID=H8H0J0_DEIGI|nr:transketolase C-terminal domain-containing protein [Deinococcus gobiensis]AFD27242.1 Transketolase central region [Deinococcus gobiensis I-0]
MSTETMTPQAATFDNRQAFAEELIRLAREDRRIVAVCNDSVGSSNLGAFQKEFPERLINVGIAEQDMVGVGAGLANAGFIPFVCAAGPFLSGRALEQIKADVAYSNFHVVLCAMSPGMAYGELGPTHHSIEDLAWINAIDNMTLLMPADAQQTRQAVQWSAENGRPVYMRVGRFKVPAVTPQDEPFEVGKAVQVREGRDVTLIGAGTTVSRALEAAELLAAQGYSARVLNMATIKPLDEDAVVRAARETGRIVTAEEATTHGGLGSMVAHVLALHHPTPMRTLGVTGFAPTGSAEYLLEHFGLTARGIADAALELL